MTGRVKAIVDRHRARLVARERTFAAANAARNRDVTQAYAQGATSTPRASDDVFEAARAWRREARAAYGDVAALGPAAFQRAEALRAYASLDAAIGHLLKALAARSDIASQYDQAARQLADFKKRYDKLGRQLG
ncbi:MAG: hypothetical protein U0R70_18490 [Solirubrobacteraceae bacterium]